MPVCLSRLTGFSVNPKPLAQREAATCELEHEVEEAADYLYQNGIVAYAYSTEIPVAVLGAKYKWARGAGLL